MKDNTSKKYCNKCVLRDDYPGVIINEEGFCNLCVGSFGDSVKNYKDALRNYNNFINDSSKHKYPYDCLVMFSGGKDSYYILYKLITENKIKPLAFSVNQPFESEIAHKNIKTAREKLYFDHIHFSANIEIYKKIMSAVFNRKRNLETQKMHDERIPCTACGYIAQISGFIYAYKIGIPYIVVGNSPSQIFGTSYDIKGAINNLTNICGIELFYKMFDKKIIDEIMSSDYESLPKFVTPYIAKMKEYDADKIIKELKEMGLYEGDSVQTYCSLVSLLNYYSYKNYSSPFFAHEVSHSLRRGGGNRKQMLEFFTMYEKIILDIATKEEINECDIEYIRNVLELKYGSGETEKVECELRNIVNMRKIAGMLNIAIE